jgi:formylglycine-generating enzyme required for sulfatase activity
MQRINIVPLLTLALSFPFASAGLGQEKPPAKPPALSIPDAQAATEAEMKPYTELIEHSDATIDLVPIRGGTFRLGSPDNEPGRKTDEGPQRDVEIAPFWMAKCELTWDAYDVWMSDLDIAKREFAKLDPSPRDSVADLLQVSQPTPPYTDMTFGMGKRGYPAICMTQHAARVYCQWLSAKTGRYYRLPSEAEWEYACRAGTTTAYHFGDDPDLLDEHAWYYENSDEKYHKVGLKKANPWGLYDMHGNVAEWVLDQYLKDGYSRFEGPLAKNPVNAPTSVYPRVVRGGGWDDLPKRLRSASRLGSDEEWSQQDPQVPQSIWYHTDALAVGFRIVRPLVEPTEEEKAAKWELSLPIQKDEE